MDIGREGLGNIMLIKRIARFRLGTEYAWLDGEMFSLVCQLIGGIEKIKKLRSDGDMWIEYQKTNDRYEGTSL